MGATENARNDNARRGNGLTTREHSGLMVMINSDYTLLLLYCYLFLSAAVYCNDLEGRFR